MSTSDWSRIQKNVASTIRLALALEIKYNALKEATSKALLEKLESIYALKLMTSRLCLKMVLHQLKMEMGRNLHD